MSKIVNTKTKEVIKNDPESYIYGVVQDFLNENGYEIKIYESLTEIIETMTGDACTPFNTIGELIKTMPDIVNYGEETAVLEIFGLHCMDYIVLGFDYEEDSELWTKILNKYYPNYVAIESED